MIKEKKKKEKITYRLNQLLIERIRKCQTQNISQLINGPNDEDTNNSFLGGLLYFDGEQNTNSDYEINNDFEKLTVNDIYIEPFQYNDYKENDEEEEEKEELSEKTKNKNKSKKKTIQYDFKNDENNSENINTLLNKDFNNYLDLIQKNYRKYESNHCPIVIDKDNKAKNNTNNNLNNLYETKKGEKIIINDEIYQKSIAYLIKEDLFYEIPPRYLNDHLEFKLDYNLLEENIDNIQNKNKEFIDINSRVATSMSKILLFSYHLEKYIKEKFEPFRNYINNSYEKVSREKYLSTEIKKKSVITSGNIILRRIKVNNIKKTISQLKKYKNLKNNMNSLEFFLLNEPQKSHEIYDLVNKCKKEIEKIKNMNIKENNKESIIEIFETKLNEFKRRNDAHMSGELSQILYKFFNNYFNIDDMNEIEINKKELFDDYKLYGITEFVLEKISSYSDVYEEILTHLFFQSPDEDLEKISKICDYYIEGNLINDIYTQLKDIFNAINEQFIQNILSIFREKINTYNREKQNNNNENTEKEDEKKKDDNYNDIKDEIINIDKEKTINNENHILKIDLETKEKDDISENDEMFILLCIILSKNKFSYTILLFIDKILTKVEKSGLIDKYLKEKIIEECKDIKKNIQEKNQNIINNQIQNCLHKISLNNNFDTYINNFYLILELIRDEHIKYKENTDNNIQLAKIIIKEQRNFIENWAKRKKIKFDSDEYKNWDIIKKIPSEYQNYLDVFFSFDIDNNCMKDESIINKYPLDKINLIKEELKEEKKKEEKKKEKIEEKIEEKTEENEDKIELLNIKDGDKPQIKIKVNQTILEIISFSFDILKMFIFFHKECYANILGNAAILFISHLNYQNDMIYEGESDFEATQSEISMSNGIFILIEHIFEHIRENEFFITIAKNCNQKLVDSYLAINHNINNCTDKSKNRIEEIIHNKCIKESLVKLEEIELPNYSLVTGDIPVKEYALMFISSLKDIYQNMIYSYEESFIIEMINKALKEFFDKFEKFIFHGQKIEDENCLKQFRKDMVFLKKNLKFIQIFDLTSIRNRIDKINKSVLPESMLTKKK